MKVKIFSYADDIQRLENVVNNWLGHAANYNEILSTIQQSVYDDFTKKVVLTITIWYK